MSIKISRNKFFEIIGKGTLVTAILTTFPINIFSSAAKKIGNKKNKFSEKIKIAIHPSAVERNGKVK